MLALAPKTSQTFKVGGGAAPYTATSSDTSAVTVALNGGNLTITGVSLGSSATLTIRDSTGVTLTVVVTVGSAKMSITPDKASAFIGDVVVATIFGGTPPYRASVGIDGTVTASIENGNQLVMTLQQLATSAIVTVLDANDQFVNFTLTITDGQDIIRLSPKTLSVVETDTQDIKLIAYGLAKGPVQVFSSNPKLLIATPPTTGNVVVVSTGTNGDRCVAADTPVTITVLDSKGSVGTAIITITDIGNISASDPCPP